MEPFHFLASDSDADPSDIAAGEAACALALGRLDGLLTGLDNAEKRLFCWALLRRTLLSALLQAGFADAELRFDGWFAGTDRAPQETPITPCPAHAVVRAILGELGRHPWPPLAEAAQAIARAGRFAPDRPLRADDSDPAAALDQAAALIRTSAAPGSPALPFPALARLAARLRQSTLFAPHERGDPSVLAGRTVAGAPAALRTPLWAVDVMLGQLLVAQSGMGLALPFPGAVTAEALAPHLHPGERVLVQAEALRRSAEQAIAALTQARSDCRDLARRLGHLRSSARAPQVWLALRGFAPLGIDQLDSAFGISRRGTYGVVDGLVEAGLARRETVLGKVSLVALPPTAPASAGARSRTPLPSPLLDEFDAAMAEVDRLLQRHAP